MKQILVVLTEQANHNVQIFSFADEESAKEFIKSKYLELIQSIERYDFENSFITKEFDKAEVSSYTDLFCLTLCNDVIEVL